MKRTILTIATALLLGIGTIAGQEPAKYTKVDAKTFAAVKKTAIVESYTPTGYTYIEKDGKPYEIYLYTPSRGKNKGVTRCYIQRVSKTTGKPYWKPIEVKPEEVKG